MFGSMANILVSLIGDQTAPNIFIIKDERFRHIDRHVFITTEQMEARGRLDHLLAATGIPESNYQKVLVSAEDIEHVRGQLNALSLDPQDRYYLNLTSGTKVMSIGLFHYFMQSGLDVQIFYLPFRKNAYRQLFPDQASGAYELSYRIDLNEYLISYGIQKEENQESNWLGPPALTQRLLDGYLKGALIQGQSIWHWAGAIRKKFNAKDAVKLSNDETAVLEVLGLNPKNTAERFAQLRYFIGGWLEQWALDQIRTELDLPEAASALGLKIRPQRIRMDRHGDNEFDVMFIYRNTLFLLECKTGLGGEYQRARRLFDQSLYRLAALRLEFGMNVYTGLLNLGTEFRDRKGRIKPAFRSRAELLKVQIIDRVDLQKGSAYWVGKLVR
jgi:hypothetical protein